MVGICEMHLIPSFTHIYLYILLCYTHVFGILFCYYYFISILVYLSGMQAKLTKRKANMAEVGLVLKKAFKSEDKHKDRVTIIPPMFPPQPPTPVIGLETLKAYGHCYVHRDDTIMLDMAKAREIKRDLITLRDYVGICSTPISELLDLFFMEGPRVSSFYFSLFLFFVNILFIFNAC